MDPFIKVRNLYLQGAPTKKVIEEIKRCPLWTEEVFQERIVNECINHPLIIKNGHVHDYEYAFIRKYFDILMEKDVYIADSFAMEYDRVHSHPEKESEYHFQYYPVPESDAVLQVKLKRSSNCTAFQTWEACFAFLEWSLQHKDEFVGKKVLELGSGSGLCGQMLQCVVKDCNIVMSDYCDEVTEYILGNIEENSQVFNNLQVPAPTVATVDFCNYDKDLLQKLHADVVIATDVTFSPDLVDGLVNTLYYCFTECIVSKALICCTIRTRDLYERFKNGIEGKGLKTVEHFLEQQNIWYYLKYADIVILEIANSHWYVC